MGKTAIFCNEPPEELPTDEDYGGGVYFIQAGLYGPVKIGWTDGNIQTRIKNLQTGCPEKLRLIGFIGGAKEVEVQKRFSSHHKRGEWFHPAVDLVDYVQTNTMTISQDAAAVLHAHKMAFNRLQNGLGSIFGYDK